MKRFVWTGAAVLVALATVFLSLPGAEAQKVANPGAITITPTGGVISLRGQSFSLAPRALPECSDGVDNDGDGRVDYVAPPGIGGDPQCTSPTDDSETAGGFQAKIDPVLNGTIDAAGNLTIPTSGVILPKAYIRVAIGSNPVFIATVIPTAPATGTINPLTGQASLRLRFRIGLTNEDGILPLGSTCSIGTTSNPININVLTTGTTSPPLPNTAISGSPYSTSGSVLLVNNSFSVPGASGCPPILFDPNGINTQINTNLGLPSPSGNNTAVIAGQTAPVVGRGVIAKITTTPTLLSGESPFSVNFSAAESTVTAAPATYLWEFPDGSTASGVSASKTFTTVGSNLVRLTVTDADGDSATVTKNVNVTPSSSTTTTTTEPTTTTTVPTTTTTTTTTTTVPTTTTTVLPGSRDAVSVRVSGSVNYNRTAESSSGNIAIQRDQLGILNVGGSVEYPGASGGTGRFTVSAQRFWIFQFWTGEVRVFDPGSGVSLQAPVFGSLSAPASTPELGGCAPGIGSACVRGTSDWFTPGSFPNLLRPFSLTWAVADRS